MFTDRTPQKTPAGEYAAGVFRLWNLIARTLLANQQRPGCGAQGAAQTSRTETTMSSRAWWPAEANKRAAERLRQCQNDGYE